MRTFCANIFAPKYYKAKMWLEKNWVRKMFIKLTTGFPHYYRGFDPDKSSTESSKTAM